MGLPRLGVLVLAPVTAVLATACGSRSALELAGSPSGGASAQGGTGAGGQGAAGSGGVGGQGAAAGSSGAPPCTAPQVEARLVGGGDGTEDHFGMSVSLFGDQAVVGARNLGIPGKPSGAAYAFGINAGGQWVQEGKLSADANHAAPTFGVAVSLWEDRALVGSYVQKQYAYPAPAGYIFEKTMSSGWVQVAKLVGDGHAQVNESAVSVSLWKDRVLIGAATARAAYVFERQATGTWVQVVKLTGSDGYPLGGFGAAVSLRGDTALVARPVLFQQVGIPGAVYVFERSATGKWLETAKLLSENLEDYFGASVSLRGNRALVGAPHDKNPSGESSSGGSAFLFERGADGAWSQNAKLVPTDAGTHEQFGWAVSLSGDRALVGSVFGGGSDDEGTGSAYMFEREPQGMWSQIAKLEDPSTDFGDNFGAAVSLSGGRALIGARFANKTGSATVFGCPPDDD